MYFRWMLRTSSDKLKIINRNEELENLYSKKKKFNDAFKKSGKIEEYLYIFFIRYLTYFVVI